MWSPLPRTEASLDRADLVAAHGPAVYALCRRLTPDPDDCYQEIREKVFRALPRFDPEGEATVRTWILTIAHRHLVDRYRRRRIRGQVLPLGEHTATDPDASDVAQAREGLLRLERALERLPMDQRRIVVLHHVHGLPLEAVAAEEGVPLGTVKSRLHRARARLATWIGRDR